MAGAQQADDGAQQRDRGERPEGHVHVGDERVELGGREAFADPEKIANSVALGIEDVMMAMTKAIERTAPVFCNSVRAPAATPRRRAGTTPIMAAVLGLLNIPEPTPTIASHSALCQ